MSGKTLVTGGAGFVGRHLVERLRAKGEHVRVFDVAPRGDADDIQGSVTDADTVARAMTDIETVFHLAGNAQLWARDNGAFDEVNHRGTQIVAEAARVASVKRFVYCSSLTTLVGQRTPIGPSIADEKTRLEPSDMLGPYPRSKLLGERAVEVEADLGLNIVIAIPTEPLGPGDESFTPPTQMILDFLNGKTPAYIDCMLNFVPVENLADGLIAARDRGRARGRYLLGGENVPMRSLLERLEKMSGRLMPKTCLPYGVALAAGVVDTGCLSRITGKPPKAPLTGVRLAGRQVTFSSDKAARELAWWANSVDEALVATLRWFEEKGYLQPKG